MLEGLSVRPLRVCRSTLIVCDLQSMISESGTLASQHPSLQYSFRPAGGLTFALVKLHLQPLQIPLIIPILTKNVFAVAEQRFMKLSGNEMVEVVFLVIGAKTVAVCATPLCGTDLGEFV